MFYQESLDNETIHAAAVRLASLVTVCVPGDASKPKTWKLPYRLMSGAVDEHHLPGAIRAIVSNYRGVRAKTILDQAVPGVLVRLGIAAAEIRKLPGLCTAPLATYKQLYDALYQLGRLDEILRETS